MKRHVFCALSVLLVLLLIGCGSGTGNGGGQLTHNLVSIQVTPANSFVTAGNTQQLKATGTFSDNSTQDITNSATWSSSDTAAATVSSSGVATAVAVGTATISAASSSVNGSTSLSVSSAAAGVADSNGMVTLDSNGLTVAVQLTDQDTAVPLKGVAVSLGNDPTVPGSAVLVIADSTGAHPLQLMLLEGPSATAAISRVAKVQVAKALPHSSPSPMTIAVSGGCPLQSGTTASAAITDPDIPPPPTPGPPSPTGLGQQLLDAINALLSLSSGVLPPGFQGPVTVQQWTAAPGESCVAQLTTIATTLLKQEAILVPAKIYLVSLLPKSVLVTAAVIGTVSMLPTVLNAASSCYYGNQSINVESVCWGSSCLNIPLGAATTPSTFPVSVTVQPPPCPSAPPGTSCTPDSLTFVNSGSLGSIVVGTTNNSGDATVQVPPGTNTVCVDSPGYQQSTEPGFIVSATGTPLNVTLTPQAQAALLVSPGSLGFSATQGASNPSSQALTINSSTGSVNWSAASNASWLSMGPTSGATPASASVSANAGGLSPGSYGGAITVTASGTSNSLVSVPVTLQVNPPCTSTGYPYCMTVTGGNVTWVPLPIGCTTFCTGYRWSGSLTADFTPPIPSSAGEIDIVFNASSVSGVATASGASQLTFAISGDSLSCMLEVNPTQILAFQGPSSSTVIASASVNWNPPHC
jgi:trimeric autotransporter adhesin